MQGLARPCKTRKTTVTLLLGTNGQKVEGEDWREYDEGAKISSTFYFTAKLTEQIFRHFPNFSPFSQGNCHGGTKGECFDAITVYWKARLSGRKRYRGEVNGKLVHLLQRVFFSV